MKIKVFIFLLFLTPSVSFSQSLSIDDLFILTNKKDISEFNDFLLDKNWIYSGNKSKEYDLPYCKGFWVIKKNNVENGILRLDYYKHNDDQKMITYVFTDHEIYKKIKSKVLSLDIEKTSNNINDKSIIHTYENQEYFISFEISPSLEQEYTFYKVVIMSSKTRGNQVIDWMKGN